MVWIVQYLWLIPALPLLAAGISALAKQDQRKLAASLAIGSMVLGFFLSCAAFVTTLGHSELFRQSYNIPWLLSGDTPVSIGWVLDPLTAAMLVMVTFVGTLIFIYSIGYMAHDENFTRFFCFLSLFAAAMLGVVISNSLLLLFICWELVGFTSYMLIGFWYHKPAAAAAAKKAFITTRVGDIGFFLGMLWLFSETGTLLFFDGGNGCLEKSALTKLVTHSTALGMAASTGISLLIFCGAIGKSGQVPLHVWLPDAMEGPTPVSALIHAATMVAAGVFLVARVYPLMAAVPVNSDVAANASPRIESVKDHATLGNPGQSLASVAAKSETGNNLPGSISGEKKVVAHPSTETISTALRTVTWVGAITAVFAALIAVAQTDIKRILAYSTVSQLGYMMMGLGVGGVAVGMFHLITHAFFKALLFLGAGSVIHGCHDEQDIRRMGGLKQFMPVTFGTYAAGMLALAGFPIISAGFWSKDDILHSAVHWPVSKGPFLLGVFGALLTAFYMTRQVCYVFGGTFRGKGREIATKGGHGIRGDRSHRQSHESDHGHDAEPHESPRVMTIPLIILAVFAVTLGFVGTPAWPWFQDFLSGQHEPAGLGQLFRWDTLAVMFLSTIVVGAGLGAGWWIYGLDPATSTEEIDPLEEMRPGWFGTLREKFYVDELYEISVIQFNAWTARILDLFDRYVLEGVVRLASYVVLAVSWLSRFVDEYIVNRGFDEGCERVRFGGRFATRFQTGQVQQYLRVIGLALTLLILLLSWGKGK